MLALVSFSDHWAGGSDGSRLASPSSREKRVDSVHEPDLSALMGRAETGERRDVDAT